MAITFMGTAITEFDITLYVLQSGCHATHCIILRVRANSLLALHTRQP